MANLTLKNLPDSLHQALKRDAEREGRSLNGHITHLLELGLAERARRRRMREGAKRLEEFVASLPPTEDSSELIRQDRDRR